MLKLSKEKKVYLNLSSRLTDLCDLLVATVDTRNEVIADLVVHELDKCIKNVKKTVNGRVNV